MKLPALLFLTVFLLPVVVFAYSFEEDNYAQALIEEGQNREALKVCESRAKQGEAWAEYCLGQIYICGRRCANSKDNIVSEDHDLAAKWYRKAAAQGHADAQYELGNFYYRSKIDYTEAAKWYLKAAQQGNDNAQDRILYMYLLGQGVKKNYTEAYFWLTLRNHLLLHNWVSVGVARNFKPRPLTPEEQALRDLPSKLTPKQKAAVGARVMTWKASPSALTQQEDAAREKYNKDRGIGATPSSP